MDFNEKLNVTGHLEVIKIDNETGKETVLFDDHNVITSGLGQSIAQFMSTSGCVTETCLTEYERFGAKPSEVAGGTENFFNEVRHGTTDNVAYASELALHAASTAGGNEAMTSGGDTTGSDLSSDTPGSLTDTITDCYCNQDMFLTVTIEWHTEKNVKMYSVLFNMVAGIGCAEEPHENLDSMEISDYVDDEEGTIHIEWNRMKNYGKCPKKGALPEGDFGDTDPCTFVWGSWVKSLTIMDNCMTTGDGKPAPLCVPPTWVKSIASAVKYGDRCPNGAATSGDSWCRAHPRNWKWEIQNAISNVLRNNDVDWASDGEARQKCKELQAG